MHEKECRYFYGSKSDKNTYIYYKNYKINDFIIVFYYTPGIGTFKIQNGFDNKNYFDLFFNKNLTKEDLLIDNLMKKFDTILDNLLFL